MRRVGSKAMCFTIRADGSDVASVTVDVPVYVAEDVPLMFLHDTYWCAATLGDGFDERVRAAVEAFTASLEESFKEGM